jgi:hypothetical protein
MTASRDSYGRRYAWAKADGMNELASAPRNAPARCRPTVSILPYPCGGTGHEGGATRERAGASTAARARPTGRRR